MKENLFSYGTLQNEDTQLKIFGRFLNGSSDTLQGYHLIPIDIKDELFLSKGEQKTQLIAIQTNDKVHRIDGMVFEMSKNELLLADKYEPVEYKRIEVQLVSGKKAWIYGENNNTETAISKLNP
jgi:hypothetical protein